MKGLNILSIVFLLLMNMITPSYAWSNGGYSTDPNVPIFGTHDYIFQKSINMLPIDMRNYINMTAAYYGTEIPDCKGGIYCRGDVAKHHVYYRANKTLQDGSAAIRAQDEYNLAKSYLQKGNKYQFSLHLGAMSHYISDVAVFGHTMGASTAWGSETHHNDFESYVENHKNSFGTSFDGKLNNIFAYNATLKLAKETTFDAGTFTNVWMDDNYKWTDPAFVSRTKYLINYDANIVADVIYTLINTTETVTVVYPNGGENWKRGTTKTIRWTKTGNIGSYVKIELLKGEIFNRLILPSTLNDGSQNWTIPAAQTIGSDYKIKITSISNGTYKDMSNGNFRIY
jgi:hypothetical protein